MKNVQLHNLIMRNSENIYVAVVVALFLLVLSCKKKETPTVSTPVTFPTTKYLTLISKARNYHSYKIEQQQIFNYFDSVFSITIINDTTLNLLKYDTAMFNVVSSNDSVLTFDHINLYSFSSITLKLNYYISKDSISIWQDLIDGGGYHGTVYYSF